MIGECSLLLLPLAAATCRYLPDLMLQGMKASTVQATIHWQLRTNAWDEAPCA